MAGFHLSIVTPDGTAFDGTAEAVSAPGELGSFGVLENHAPMVAGLQPGVFSVTAEGKTSYFAVGEGWLEVSFGNEVSVLLDSAAAADSKEQAQKLIAERSG